MAAYAAREANPLYPVPRLMDAKELERFYYKVSGLRAVEFWHAAPHTADKEAV